MKRKSIKTAILLPVLAVLIVGIFAMVMVVGTIGSNTTGDLSERLVDARVGEYTNEFQALSRDAYSSLKAVTPIIANYIDPAFAADVSDPRGEVVSILSDVLMSNDKIVGIWTCWEPDAFDGKDSEFAGTSFYDGAGRFAPYVYKTGSSYDIESLVDYDNEEFYLGPLNNNGQPYITDAYDYLIDGKTIPIYSLALSIQVNGKTVGVVGADIDLQSVIDIMNAGSILDDGYLFVLSPGGQVASHRNEDLLLQSYKTTWMNDYSAQVDDIAANGGEFAVTTYSDQVGAEIMFLARGVIIGDTGRYWVVCGVVPMVKVNEPTSSLFFTVIAVGLALLVVVGLTVFFIVRSRLKQLPVLTSAADALAVGDIEVSGLDEDTAQTKNEISLLSRAFAGMVSGIREQAGILEQVATGDYSIEIPVRSEKDTMNTAINHLLDSMNEAMGELSEASSQVAAGAGQVADGSQALATGSTQQAATVEEFSATIAALNAQAEENTKLAQDTLSDTEQAGVLMGESINYMGELTQAMQTIDASSQDIAKVIKVIDDIAFQTNILALNAAVEAARAGQHGKGFAVVADEVRNLASKSAAAAKETGVLIQNSVENVQEGTRIAEATGDSLGKVSDIAGRNAQAMVRLSESSQSQTEAIIQINQGVNQISSVIQANSATAEESAAASEEMSAQSAVLNKIVTRFKLKRGRQHTTPPTQLLPPSHEQVKAGGDDILF